METTTKYPDLTREEIGRAWGVWGSSYQQSCWVLINKKDKCIVWRSDDYIHVVATMKRYVVVENKDIYQIAYIEKEVPDGDIS